MRLFNTTGILQKKKTKQDKTKQNKTKQKFMWFSGASLLRKMLDPPLSKALSKRNGF